MQSTQTQNTDKVQVATKYLTSKEVLSMLKISNATLWRMVNNGNFPKPLNLFGNVKRYELKAVLDYIENIKRGLNEN
ncbi:helix-turn-helix transcriptional regulator [Campylobacter fetus]|uniref:helix-turn-helix transcriptional regulator n=1 Tax=Campylobacter fetus TaxID=196 RepID=UPI000CFC6FD6|nr:helix-turn-helix domain-containing protein [Campylobacter fetus]AVK81967.1 DNA-binding protein [Campylobacter fetus subsp. testudinum]